MPIGISISSLKTRFPMLKEHFVMRNEIASVKVCLVNYHLPQPFDVR